MTDQEALIATLDDAKASHRAALTVAEVARILDLDPRTVTASIADGTVPAVRMGRRVLIPREAFVRIFSAEPVEARV